MGIRSRGRVIAITSGSVAIQRARLILFRPLTQLTQEQLCLLCQMQRDLLAFVGSFYALTALLLHRPSLRREESPCQPEAVHTMALKRPSPVPPEGLLTGVLRTRNDRGEFFCP
jgi:hypothetical protein